MLHLSCLLEVQFVEQCSMHKAVEGGGAFIRADASVRSGRKSVFKLMLHPFFELATTAVNGILKTLLCVSSNLFYRGS